MILCQCVRRWLCSSKSGLRYPSLWSFSTTALLKKLSLLLSYSLIAFSRASYSSVLFRTIMLYLLSACCEIDGVLILFLSSFAHFFARSSGVKIFGTVFSPPVCADYTKVSALRQIPSCFASHPCISSSLSPIETRASSRCAAQAMRHFFRGRIVIFRDCVHVVPVCVNQLLPHIVQHRRYFPTYAAHVVSHFPESPFSDFRKQAAPIRRLAFAMMLGFSAKRLYSRCFPASHNEILEISAKQVAVTSNVLIALHSAIGISHGVHNFSVSLGHFQNLRIDFSSLSV